jgi:2-keto-4-pentenoate hydratase/2-oxohepta-3-ene-1,7-dioic acid hydratase in catechol pathway
MIEIAMKLMTFKKGKEYGLGVLVKDQVLDLNAAFEEHLGGSFKGEETPCLDMLSFLDLGAKGLAEAKKAMKEVDEASALFKLSKIKVASPIPRPRKNIVCLGLNYADHVHEGSKARNEPPRDLPSVPIFFTKPATAVVGPSDDIIYPRVTEKLDYELELAFVVGKAGKYIPEEKAYDHIAGYTVFNDISARDLQRAHQQWYRGKSLDTFAPMGPYIVTSDEVGDPQNLDMWLKVNGEERQKSNTKHMIFSIKKIMSTLSAGITLEIGDIFATGTPSGVGSAHPKGLLKVGDEVEAWIQKVGSLKNRVVAEK